MELSYADLVRRAVMNARSRLNGDHPRWACVSDSFGLGSTYSIELCKLFNLDPHEIISGVRCLACEP
jgi:hypothetical protein